MEDFFNYKNIIIIQYIGETSNMRRLIRNRMNVKSEIRPLQRLGKLCVII